jgi:serine/threonine protein kinase
MSPRREPAPPPRIEGYEFQRLLGSGGFADVYLYERELPRMPVAVKVLVSGHLDEQDRDRFTHEANVMARFYSHPYIVGILSADVAADGRPYIVMQYYPRDNLWVRSRQAPLGVAEALQIGVQIASAVETAHRAGVLHRDIKPANVLTSEFGDPGLADFGISVTKDRPSNDEGALSVPWSPPEAFDSDATLDERSDVYSLAATVYTLLTGRSPFEANKGSNNAAELMSRIEREPVRPTGRADVPDTLERVLRQAMSKQPELRHPTALAFARDLQAVERELRLTLTTIVVPEDPVPERPRLGDDDEETRGRMPRQIAPHVPGHVGAQAPPSSVRRPPAAGPSPAGSAGSAPSPGRFADLSTAATALRSGAPAIRQPVSGSLAPEELDGTLRRVSSIESQGQGDGDAGTPEDDGPVGEPTPGTKAARRNRLFVVAGVAAAVVVAVVVVAMVLLLPSTPARSTGAAGSPTSSPSTTSPSAVFVGSVPTPTNVTASRSGAQLVVSWSNPNSQPGDFFVVLTTVDGSQQPPVQTTKTTTTVPDASGAAVCAQVELVLQDGQASTPSSPVCGS